MVKSRFFVKRYKNDAGENYSDSVTGEIKPGVSYACRRHNPSVLLQKKFKQFVRCTKRKDDKDAEYEELELVDRDSAVSGREETGQESGEGASEDVQDPVAQLKISY
jgi:hypothetical protein